jgi:hypothetical protein
MMNGKDLEGRTMSQARFVLRLSRVQSSTKKICCNYERFFGPGIEKYFVQIPALSLHYVSSVWNIQGDQKSLCTL